MSEKAPTTETYISPAQLCVGLHVQLDMPWTEHPFTFSSFKIKSLEQIVALQALGLTRIRFNQSKSDGEPLAVPKGVPAEPAPPASHEGDPLYQAKRARVERLLAQQARVATCEREFLTSARAVKSINQNLFAKPDQSRQEAEWLVQELLAGAQRAR